MSRQPHDIQDAALSQLETALCLFDKGDYYSVITLAGAAEEIFGEFRLMLLRTDLRRSFEREEFKACFPSEGTSCQSRSLSAVSDDLLKVWNEVPGKLPKSEKDPYLFLLASKEGPTKLRDKLLELAKKEKELLKKFENIVEENLKELENSGNQTDPCKPLLDSFKQTIAKNKPTLAYLADFVAQSCVNREDSDDLRKCYFWVANWVRNLLKHGFPGQPNGVMFDAREVATHTLQRAISNYYLLPGNPTPAMIKFHDEHPKGLWVLTPQP